MTTIDTIKLGLTMAFFAGVAWYWMLGGRQWLKNRKALKTAGTKSFKLDVCEP